MTAGADDGAGPRSAAGPGRHLFVVVSNAVPGREVEYHRWYEAHVRDLLRLPGFLSAQRFEVSADQGRERRIDHRYMVVYEIAGNPGDAVRAVSAASAAGVVERPDPSCVEADIYGIAYSPLSEKLHPHREALEGTG